MQFEPFLPVPTERVRATKRSDPARFRWSLKAGDPRSARGGHEGCGHGQETWLCRFQTPVCRQFPARPQQDARPRPRLQQGRAYADVPKEPRCRAETPSLRTVWRRPDGRHPQPALPARARHRMLFRFPGCPILRSIWRRAELRHRPRWKRAPSFPSSDRRHGVGTRPGPR